MDFIELFEYLDDLYLVDTLLPFILIFTVLFAILQKSNILGEDKRNFNVVVATVISLMVVIPHVTGSYPADRDVVEIMLNALPQISIIVIAILMALLLIGIFGGEAKWMGGSLSGGIALIAFIIVVYVFGAEAGWWHNYPSDWNLWGSETTSIVLVILVFAIVIWYITREPTKADQAGAFSNALDKFGDMFKK